MNIFKEAGKKSPGNDAKQTLGSNMKKISFKGYPEYQEALEKGNELREGLDQVVKKIFTMEKERAFGVEDVDKIHLEALQLLGEAPDNSSQKEEELISLKRQEMVLREARNMQSRKTAEIKGHITKEFCNQVRPQYAKIVGRLVKAVTALEEVILEEKAFQRNLHQEHIHEPCLIPRPDFLATRYFSDFEQKVSRLKKEAKQHKYIKG